MKMFDCFKCTKELIDKTKFVKAYKFFCDDKEYKIVLTKRFANKHTIIHFIDNTICWEQIPRFHKLEGRMYGDRIPIYKFDTDYNGKVPNTLLL